VYGWRIDTASSFGADRFERGGKARESPGEIRNLAVALDAPCFERLNPPASFSVHQSRHKE
jgi:hypothetical protein